MLGRVLRVLARLGALRELRIVDGLLVAQLGCPAHEVHIGHPGGDLAHLGHRPDLVYCVAGVLVKRVLVVIGAHRGS